MTLRSTLARLAWRDPDRPTLRERLAAGRAHPGGSALAGPPAARPHPDQALLDAEAALLAAHARADAADIAYHPAMLAVHAALDRCPARLLPTDEEYRMCAVPHGYRPWGDVRFWWVPTAPGRAGHDAWRTVVWTSPALRHVLARAVAVEGRGGRTPALIRRWKALLPVADAFDAEVAATEGAADYHRLNRERDEARAAVDRQRAVIGGSVATTPEGLAAPVRVVGEYGWKDMGGAWPDLLRSAAAVARVDPANLAAFCQRCHMLHDAPEHRRRRWATLFRRRAMGDLFRGPYPPV